MFNNRSILIIGGTGSLGKTLTRRILSGKHGRPKVVTILSRDEAKQYFMAEEFGQHTSLKFLIGDVRRYEDVLDAMDSHQIVVNAAALKQVPSCEYAPEQAMLTNCQGPINIVHAARRLSPWCVVGVSTDKACEPVNAMGITKALQERIMVAANVDSSYTHFVCVRYGNVLASRGSVIPLFMRQIAAGGPVTITDLRMTRFLLSLEQAVDTILHAIEHAKRGDVVVPMAASATVLDVANVLVAARDAADNRTIETKITGIRPGEKIHETLVSETEASRTIRVADYLHITPPMPELDPNPDQVKTLLAPYRSSDAILSRDGVRALLALHGLLDPEAFSSKREVLA